MAYGYGAPVGVAPTGGMGGFALIVVLFILLIIVGAAWM
nr:YjcZ family sporulation protein [Litchfieldia alkalitelluris]